MDYVSGLRCRECGTDFDQAPVHVCDECFGALEVQYDFERISQVLTRDLIESRPRNLWRYRELLPNGGEPQIGLYSGWTPLVRAERLAQHWGVDEVYLKDDSANHPSFSYKDRVVPVAIAKAVEFGMDTVACASTGNLANSVAAHAARAGLTCYIFIPEGLEQGKVIGSTIFAPNAVTVRGNYDAVDRLCSEIADRYPWAFVNINLRPYYIQGAKTFGYEIAEQLGWRFPDHVVVPTAGGTLLPTVARAFAELAQVGLVGGDLPRIHCAQAAGASPIIQALHSDADVIKPVKPDTIAKSIAIGDPGDGYDVLATLQASGGWGESATDVEIVNAIQLLARTEGIFTEPAGGATLAATGKLIDQGRIAPNESIVVSITGNGYKTVDAVAASLPGPHVIDANLADFNNLQQDLHSRQDR